MAVEHPLQPDSPIVTVCAELTEVRPGHKPRQLTARRLSECSAGVGLSQKALLLDLLELFFLPSS